MPWRPAQILLKQVLREVKAQAWVGAGQSQGLHRSPWVAVCSEWMGLVLPVNIFMKLVLFLG